MGVCMGEEPTVKEELTVSKPQHPGRLHPWKHSDGNMKNQNLA